MRGIDNVLHDRATLLMQNKYIFGQMLSRHLTLEVIMSDITDALF